MKIQLILFFVLCFTPVIWAQEDSTKRIIADTPAEFPGGHSAMNNYVKENFHYPQEAQDLGIQGKCYVSFIIEPDGSITDVRVIRAIPDCHECDKEAVRLIRGMPKWVPATHYGVPVQSKYTTFLSFRVY